MTVETVDTSQPTRLGFADDGPVAADAAQQVATAIGAALDTHLDNAQRGTPDLGVLGARWLNETNPTAADALRTKLTNADLPVEQASYTVTVQGEPTPTLAVAVVEVVRRDGSTVGAELVFDVTGEKPVLHLLGPIGGEA